MILEAKVVDFGLCSLWLAAVTATVPTSNSSPLASAQALRQRHGRLSPLRLGIYGLVSLGSHLLLLGLFRWAWQVQLATQPVGSPIGIDFVEVDLSDGSFEGQLPDESATASTSGGKLSAAQLNELIARGEAAPTDLSEPSPELLEPGQSEVGADRSSATDATQVASVPDASPPVEAEGGQAEPPRSWFPLGQSRENSGGGLFGDRPLPATPSPAPTTSSANTEQGDRANDTASSSAEADANTNSNSNSNNTGSEVEAPTPSETDNSASTSPSNPTSATDTAATRPTATDSPDAPTEPAVEATGNEPGQTGNSDDSASANDSESGSSGSNSNGSNSSGSNSATSPGRPNDLPPNMSDRPVSPDQTVQPNEATPEPGDSNNTQPPGEASNDGTVSANPGGSFEPTGGASSGTGGEPASDATASESPAQPGDTNGSTPGEASGNGETEGSTDAENPVASRLGAALIVDEAQSRALNTRDVFTRLPRPLADPLGGSQSGNSGRCAGLLAALTPVNYGQPVELILPVDVGGDAYDANVVGGQAQTAVGKAIACIAEEWAFEPAQRVINEGGVEKVENTGAVLFVTVTISPL